jgi:hypothetical protein
VTTCATTGGTACALVVARLDVRSGRDLGRGLRDDDVDVGLTGLGHEDGLVPSSDDSLLPQDLVPTGFDGEGAASRALLHRAGLVIGMVHGMPTLLPHRRDLGRWGHGDR